jgi:hypothetical protein
LTEELSELPWKKRLSHNFVGSGSFFFSS